MKEFKINNIEEYKEKIFDEIKQIDDHFPVKAKVVKSGATTKGVIDYKLSRYACYLITKNASLVRHKLVTLGQTLPNAIKIFNAKDLVEVAKSIKTVVVNNLVFPIIKGIRFFFFITI